MRSITFRAAGSGPRTLVARSRVGLVEGILEIRAPGLDGALTKERVGEGEAGHRLGDGHDAGTQTGIVTPRDLEVARHALQVDGLLGNGDRGRGLDRDARHDRLAGRNPPPGPSRLDRGGTPRRPP